MDGNLIEEVVFLVILIVYCITIVGLVLVVIAENRNPLKTIPWVVVLLLAPGIGLFFYFLFGQDNRKQRIISRYTYKRIKNKPRSGVLQQDLCAVPTDYKPLEHLLQTTNQAVSLYGTNIKVFTHGADKIEALLKDIAEAKHHIHLQYYIISNDVVGTTIKNALIAKAKEGVQVRVLYDDVGCWNVKSSFFKEMKQAGIEVSGFLRVAFPIFSSKVNYRNHRKVVVIDGHIGYMGGMNIADRYVNGTSWGTWRDTHFRLEGKGAHGLQSAFLIDWYVCNKTLLTSKHYYPPVDVFSHNIMQIVTSGPTGEWNTLLQGVIYAFANAKKSILIQTPYFLPSEGLNTALQTAALSGIEVKLMLPKRADSKIITLATHSFLDDLVKAGVKIYLYKPGFLHSKLVVCDDSLAIIGSANMDFRSFEHNFEVNAFVYDRHFAKQMHTIFENDQANCEPLQQAKWLKRALRKRLAESFIRLFSPLL
jgi:cardiolipin synthase